MCVLVPKRLGYFLVIDGRKPHRQSSRLNS
jgi:hypothetical protein